MFTDAYLQVVKTSTAQHFRCLSVGIEVMSQEVSVKAEKIFAQRKEALNITLLGSEWNSLAGGLSTLNRELAIHLSQHPNVSVSMLVPEGACKDEDRKAAKDLEINVLDARQRPGFREPLACLCFPPEDHRMDVVIGHGAKLGWQVQVIKLSAQFQNCKWVHMVHTAPEDLSKYKGYDNPTSRGEQKHWDEVELCKEADLVVPVGPRLEKAYSSYLKGSKKDRDIFEIVPGLFNREFGDLVQQAKVESDDDFKVLLCGRGDKEDFELKGYDIAVKAFVDQRLKGKRYNLLFVGAPDGKQDEVRRRLLNCGITEEQLTVRKFVQSRAGMKDLFCEVDLVIMPSKSEGFGLVALEALSAGLPILVGSNSGFARALEEIDFGDTCIVCSNDPAEWAKKIEVVRAKHKKRLREMTYVRESYEEKFCWKEQCGNLVEKLWKMVHENSTFQATAEDGSDEQQLFAVSSLPVAVCQADPKIMEQHAGMMECEVTTCKENVKKSGKRKISESNSEEGMDSSGSAKLPRAEQQLPAVTSGALYKHSVHKEKIYEEKKVLKTYGDKHSLVEVEVEGKDKFYF
ncbi:D-inositol 3-phosphate glycosyltransferase-like [Montipora capricornis]|uniref:D-inositol 3-phosphate glycosyltransferase-like n=1 Tax=Montipora capricornis TaxID=246305 RepID=UPI0035F12B87